MVLVATPNEPFEIVVPIKPAFSGLTSIPVHFIMTYTNNEDIDVYIRVYIVTPPADWTVYSADLGLVVAGTTGYKLVQFQRNVPTLTAGEYSETLTLRVEVYSDSTYTTLIGSRDFTVTFTFIDPTDPAWTLIDFDDFEGTTEGWSKVIEGLGIPTASYITSAFVFTGSTYITGSASLGIGLNNLAGSPQSSVKKTFDATGYTKAYFIMHIYVYSTFTSGCVVKIGDKIAMNQAMSLNLRDRWVIIAQQVPTSTFDVYIRPIYKANGTGVLVDAVYLIAK